MPFLILFFLICFLGLAIASFTDFKNRTVPNALTFSMIFSGLLLHFIQSLLSQNFLLFLTALAVTFATFAVAFLLWKLGVWAGGDVKVFTAIAALSPFNLAFFPNLLHYNNIFSPLQIPLFPLTLFVFSLFAMLPYSLALTIGGIFRNKKLLKKTLKEFNAFTFRLLHFAAFIIGFEAVLLHFNLAWFFVFPAIIVYGFLKSRFQVFLAIAFFPAALLLDFSQNFANFFLIFIPLFALYALIKLFVLSKKQVLQKQVKPSKLKEGDIIAESVVKEKNHYCIQKPLPLTLIIKYLKTNKLKQLLASRKKAIVIVNGGKAAGITIEELKVLKKLERQGVVGKLTVKLSVPFVPAVLIAFIVLNLIGDVFWLLFF